MPDLILTRLYSLQKQGSKVLALSICSSIKSRNCFLRGIGDRNFDQKAAICGHHI